MKTFSFIANDLQRMRFSAITLLILIYLGGLFRAMVPYAYYQINQEYIAAYLCENISRPELKCGGKCFLMKQSKKLRSGQDGKANLPPGQGMEHAEKMFHDAVSFDEDFSVSLFLSTHLPVNEGLPGSVYLRTETPPPQV